jgi:signal transduction histidine kinase
MRRRLALVMVATTTLVVLSLLIPLAKAVKQIPREREISYAQNISQALLRAIGAVRDPAELARVVAQTNDINGQNVSLVLPDGTRLGVPFTSSVATNEAETGRSLNARIPGGVEVLTATALGDGTAVVRVAVSDATLSKGVRTAWAILAGLGVLLVLLAVAVSDRLARSIVKPITALAATTRALEQGHLDARVTLGGPPEVREVGYTLNLLADRIGQLLVSEREAIADLSHRLRTPITALRLNAEGLTNEVEAQRITSDIDELTKAVDALIRSAREPMTAAASSCDLVAVVIERGRFWKPLAEEQSRDLLVTASDGPLWVAVSDDGLGAAIDALIGNVFSHTDEGVGFSLRASQLRDRAVLYVDDDGQGLKEHSDVRGVSGSGSTGLGLSIVRSTVELVGGSFMLAKSPTGGTRVTIDLPIIRLR